MDSQAVLQAGTLDALIGLVRQHTGIAMNERKSVLLEGRLRPRMRALALSRYEDYLELLRAGGNEIQTFRCLLKVDNIVCYFEGVGGHDGVPKVPRVPRVLGVPKVPGVLFMILRICRLM